MWRSSSESGCKSHRRHYQVDRRSGQGASAIAAGGWVAVLFTGDMEDENSSVSNWVDVLGVYSVYATTGDNAAEVITVTPENNEKLRKIFYDMNSYSVHTETETVEEVEVDDYGATLASVSSN